jgi:hypothetical protein
MNTLVEKATYSPEDNKLRLYVIDNGERFDEKTYSRIKDCSFMWAPKQRLFFAHWSVGGEDLMVELAGKISLELTTLVERAEAKAERLLELSERRESEGLHLQAATERIMSSLTSGQPILVGHHSERKMRKQLEKAERDSDKAEQLVSASAYWNYRARGVIGHVNYKNRDDVRVRRMEKLLTDLRSEQRWLNHAASMVRLWSKIQAEQCEEKRAKLVRYYSGVRMSNSGATFPCAYGEAWSSLDKEQATVQEVLEKTLVHWNAVLNSTRIKRTIGHLLNRLRYERDMLGPTPRFNGKVTAAIVKAFARKHGTDSPECKKVDGLWQLQSKVPLPLHLADGNTLYLSDEDWCALMVEVGYVVPAPKPKKAPILNFQAKSIRLKGWGSVEDYKQISMTKQEYSDIYSDYRGVKESECGQFRVKFCRDPKGRGYAAEWFCVFLTDSKEHAIPESPSITKCEEVA